MAERTGDSMKNYFGETHQYDDIIDLPHHVSTRRPQMPVADRAAQFASFAALTGYGSAIRETTRRHEENELRPDVELHPERWNDQESEEYTE